MSATTTNGIKEILQNATEIFKLGTSDVTIIGVPTWLLPNSKEEEEILRNISASVKIPETTKAAAITFTENSTSSISVEVQDTTTKSLPFSEEIVTETSKHLPSSEESVIETKVSAEETSASTKESMESTKSKSLPSSQGTVAKTKVSIEGTSATTKESMETTKSENLSSSEETVIEHKVSVEETPATTEESMESTKSKSLPSSKETVTETKASTKSLSSSEGTATEEVSEKESTASTKKSMKPTATTRETPVPTDELQNEIITTEINNYKEIEALSTTIEEGAKIGEEDYKATEVSSSVASAVSSAKGPSSNHHMELEEKSSISEIFFSGLEQHTDVLSIEQSSSIHTTTPPESSKVVSSGEGSSKKSPSTTTEAGTVHEELLSENGFGMFSNQSESSTVSSSNAFVSNSLSNEAETEMENKERFSLSQVENSSESLELASDSSLTTLEQTHKESSNVPESSFYRQEENNSKSISSSLTLQQPEGSKIPLKKTEMPSTEANAIHEEILNENIIHFSNGLSVTDNDDTKPSTGGLVPQTDNISSSRVTLQASTKSVTENYQEYSQSGITDKKETKIGQDLIDSKDLEGSLSKLIKSTTSEAGTIREEMLTEYVIDKFSQNAFDNISLSEQKTLSLEDESTKMADSSHKALSATESQTDSASKTSIEHDILVKASAPSYEAPTSSKEATIVNAEETFSLKTQDPPDETTPASEKEHNVTQLSKDMKHTAPAKPEGTVSEETFDENNMEHFSHRQKTTLCENCDKNENSVNFVASTSFIGGGSSKHTVPRNFPSSVSLEIKEEDILEHFSHQPQSTLCENCEENRKTYTQSSFYSELTELTDSTKLAAKTVHTPGSGRKKVSLPIPIEVPNDDNMEHFSHQVSSTLCENCEEKENISTYTTVGGKIAEATSNEKASAEKVSVAQTTFLTSETAESKSEEKPKNAFEVVGRTTSEEQASLITSQENIMSEHHSTLSESERATTASQSEISQFASSEVLSEVLSTVSSVSSSTLEQETERKFVSDHHKEETISIDLQSEINQLTTSEVLSEQASTVLLAASSIEAASLSPETEGKKETTSQLTTLEVLTSRSSVSESVLESNGLLTLLSTTESKAGSSKNAEGEPSVESSSEAAITGKHLAKSSLEPIEKKGKSEVGAKTLSTPEGEVGESKHITAESKSLGSSSEANVESENKASAKATQEVEVGSSKGTTEAEKASFKSSSETEKKNESENNVSAASAPETETNESTYASTEIQESVESSLETKGKTEVGAETLSTPEGEVGGSEHTSAKSKSLESSSKAAVESENKAIAESTQQVEVGTSKGTTEAEKAFKSSLKGEEENESESYVKAASAPETETNKSTYASTELQESVESSLETKGKTKVGAEGEVGASEHISAKSKSLESSSKAAVESENKASATAIPESEVGTSKGTTAAAEASLKSSPNGEEENESESNVKAASAPETEINGSTYSSTEVQSSVESSLETKGKSIIGVETSSIPEGEVGGSEYITAESKSLESSSKAAVENENKAIAEATLESDVGTSKGTNAAEEASLKSSSKVEEENKSESNVKAVSTSESEANGFTHASSEIEGSVKSSLNAKSKSEGGVESTPENEFALKSSFESQANSKVSRTPENKVGASEITTAAGENSLEPSPNTEGGGEVTFTQEGDVSKSKYTSTKGEISIESSQEITSNSEAGAEIKPLPESEAGELKHTSTEGEYLLQASSEAENKSENKDKATLESEADGLKHTTTGRESTSHSLFEAGGKNENESSVEVASTLESEAGEIFSKTSLQAESKSEGSVEIEANGSKHANTKVMVSVQPSSTVGSKGGNELGAEVVSLAHEESSASESELAIESSSGREEYFSTVSSNEAKVEVLLTTVNQETNSLVNQLSTKERQNDDATYSSTSASSENPGSEIEALTSYKIFTEATITHTNLEGTNKHTATTNFFTAISPEVQDENMMEHFSHKSPSTICEKCNENGKNTQSESFKDASLESETTEATNVGDQSLSKSTSVGKESFEGESVEASTAESSVLLTHPNQDHLTLSKISNESTEASTESRVSSASETAEEIESNQEKETSVEEFRTSGMEQITTLEATSKITPQAENISHPSSEEQKTSTEALSESGLIKVASEDQASSTSQTVEGTTTEAENISHTLSEEQKSSTEALSESGLIKLASENQVSSASQTVEAIGSNQKGVTSAEELKSSGVEQISSLEVTLEENYSLSEKPTSNRPEENAEDNASAKSFNEQSVPEATVELITHGLLEGSTAFHPEFASSEELNETETSISSQPTGEFFSHKSSIKEQEPTMEEGEEGLFLTLNLTSTKEVDFFNNLTEGTTVVQEVTSTISESTVNTNFEQTELLATTESSSPTTKLEPVTKNGNLTTSEIHIDLPIYLPNSSETPESFLKFYTSEMQTVIIDDEATDITVADDYKRMSPADFNVVTEFPLTAEVESNHASLTGSKAEESSNVTKDLTTPPHEQEKLSDAGLIIPGELQQKYVPNGCTASDYQNAKGCFCVMDEMLARLNHALHDKDLPQKVDSLQCQSFFKVKEGLMINNETVENRVKRSYLFLKHQQELGVVKRETIPYGQIEHILKVTTNIQNTDTKMFAVPGSKVVIPCTSGDITETEGSSNKYSWTSSGGRPLTEGKVQEKNGNLSIENLTAQDGGNYTCSIVTPTNENESSREHQLVIIDLPTYIVNAHVVYNMTKPCNLTDVDIMSSYLPTSVKELLCGFKCKFCDVKVHKPHCAKIDDKSHMSLFISVSLQPLKTILPSLAPKICDVNCQMHIYSKIANALVKNVQNIETIPVVSKLNRRKVNLFPTQVTKKKAEAEVTQPTELVIGCPAGFGFRKPERICSACLPNTYSAGDESYCTPCALGEYQPVSGSKSCLSCTSPLQDPSCLRIMYSNAKAFRVYVGLGFSTVVLLIAIVLCCSSAAKKTEKPIAISDRHRKHYKSELSKGRRSRNPDVEQALEPLLSEGHKRSRRPVPPKPPPPDFF